MTKQLRPIIHARDHLPDGADPIPNLLVAAGSYQEQILREPSLIGYWPLDDADEPALDHSTSGRNLEESFVAPTWGEPGPFADDPAATSVFFDVAAGFSVSYDALEDNNAGSPYYFNDPEPFTFEILLYPTAFGADAGIMGVYTPPGGEPGGIYLKLTSAGNVRVLRAGETNDSPVALTLDEWVHLAVTWDAATLRLYFDGEEQFAEATTAAHSGSGRLRLGVYRQDSGYRDTLHGRLAQAAIYNEALSATTIALHANTRIGGGTDTGGGAGPPGADGADGAPGVGVPAGGTADQVLTKDSGTDYDTSWQDAAGGGGGAVDVQALTSTSPTNWTKPAGCTMVEVILYGAGGGGGGGRSGGSPTSGASGGGGGACTRQVFRASDLPGTVSVTCGTGGTAGTAAPTSGGVGGTSTFGTYAAACGGGGGIAAGQGAAVSGGSGGGQNDPGVAGSTANRVGGGNPLAAGTAGLGGAGAGSAQGGVGGNAEFGGASGGGASNGFGGAPGGNSIYGGAGGGSGSGNGPAGQQGAGGVGGKSGNQNAWTGAVGAGGNGGAAGGTAGSPGTDGSSLSGGGGGGGGGSKNTAGGSGGVGGQGGTHGGGGGGGGSGTSGTTTPGGAGGVGGAGRVYVYAW